MRIFLSESFHSAAFKKELRSILYCLFLVAYCFMVKPLGFVISTVILVLAIMVYYGARKWYYYAIPLAMVGIVYYVFRVVLHVSLPKRGRRKIMEQFLGGLQILLNWRNFLIIPVGLVIGIVVGAIPGLTSDLGIILCIPLTYGMDPTMAILMLLAIYCGGTYGGYHGDPHQYARYIRQCGKTV